MSEEKCARCNHPQSWHRHDADSHDPSDPDYPFRCLGYDCDKPGYPAGTPETRCGCPDFVGLTGEFHLRGYCTIRFIQCPLGHGRLTATNCVDSGCPHCALATERQKVRQLRETLATFSTAACQEGWWGQNNYQQGWKAMAAHAIIHMDALGLGEEREG